MTSRAGRKSRPTDGRDVECVEGIALDPLADEGAHHSDQLIGRICGVRRGSKMFPDGPDDCPADSDPPRHDQA